MKKLLSAVLVAAILFSSLAFCSGAVTSYEDWSQKWEEIKESDGYIILSPGADRTKMNFSWQSPFISKRESIVVGQEADLSDGQALKVRRSLCIFGFEWTNEATVSDLKESTTYYYRYTVKNTESEIYSFTTGSSDKTKVIFFTDSQIGRYRGSDVDDEIYSHDTYGWTSTLETAIENNDNIDFLLSAGDQIEDSYSEEQYSMFESAPYLRNYPIAACVGNHDFYTTNFSHHFNTPNDTTLVPAKWPGSNGYYFSYNDILFIVLDSNNIISEACNAVMRKAVKKYPDAKWRVVMMHHSPYDANADKSTINKMMRTTITPYIDKYGIDLVLCGHDHYYSRSYIIKNKKVTNDVAVNDVYTNPSGALYISGNSASGSNLDGIDEDNVCKYCDLYIQNRIPTYSVVDFVGSKLTVSTYETDQNKLIDTVSIVKE